MVHHLDRIGQRIGDYHLLRWLGGGSFGDVYFAQHLRDHSQVAIKLLHNRLSRNENLKAFINEARTVRLKHPHIVPLLDFGISREGIPYLVMEYAAQGTLGDCYPKGVPVPLSLVADYALQVGSALQYAHDQRLIHRDVKPHNMLLREDGTVLLSDFGLVAVAHSSSSQDSDERMGIGTTAYMAPEQIQGQPKAASDQYSLGVVVYEWITGRCPFEGTAFEVGRQHLMNPPPSLRAQIPTLSRAVEEVVLKALAKDPKERFVTVQAFVLALAQVTQGASAAPDTHQISSLDHHEPVSSSYAGPVPVPPPPTRKLRVDWGEALTVPFFYGREQEQAQLTRWVTQDHCRVASVVGMGGIGKSALVINVAHQVSEGTMALTSPFEVVIVRSLRDAPSCEALLDDCLQVLSPQPQDAMAVTLERRISLLLSCLREVRTLIVLDNLEDLLSAGNTRGQFRPGFEGYEQLLRRIAETEHQSCLLLTSREKPSALRLLEGKSSAVRTLRLRGLDTSACRQLLEEKELVGTEQEMEQLVEIYVGNPLALKIVARTIVDLFAVKINLFLDSGIVVFGSITDLLGEQFARLSALEQSVLCWLAIMREPVTLDELSALLVTQVSRLQVLEAVDAGYRRSLIERGKRAGTFTLQSVVLEYVTTVLVTEACREVKLRHLDKLIQYGLSQAHAKEYVRQTQERLLLSPLLGNLHSIYLGQVNGPAQEPRNGANPFPAPPPMLPVEQQLLALLDDLRREAEAAQGYGPANLIALLRLLRGSLSGLDLSQLCVRGAYLQGIEMQDASLAGAMLRDTLFTQAFDVIRSVAISHDGRLWAVGSARGEVRVWREGGQSLHLVWQAHTDIIFSLAFSPDGRTLASSGVDGTVKLWDLSQGALLWTGWHTDVICAVAFAPDGRMLASCGADAVVRLWDVTSGTNLQALSSDGSRLFSLAWSPDGSLLAGGSFDGSIRLWHLQETQPTPRPTILAGHTGWVWGLAFAPNSRQLASGSWDRTVKLWEVESGQCQTLKDYTQQVHDIAWSRDGRMVAIASSDKTICVFDVEQDSYRAALHGHTAIVYSVAFTPDSRGLLSGSEDGTVRVWDVASGQCVRVVEGCAVILYDVAWSPDSTRLASAGTDMLVTIWDVTGGTQPKVLRGHSWHLFGVVWSPDGRLLASSGRDNAVRVWDPTTGECRQVLRDPDYVDTMFYSVAWSPDGRLLACGSYMRGVQVWDVLTGIRCWVGQHPTRVRRVAWSPDGARLAGSGDDGSVSLWAASNGTLLGRLQGHSGIVMSVAWSPDGTRLVSGGGGRDGGELFVWDVGSRKVGPYGELVQTLKGHPGSVFAVVWSPTGEVVISGGSDGTIRWWNVEAAECLRTCKGHEGGVWSLRVSPDGRLLASCGNDSTNRVWDLQSARLLRTLRHDRPYERLNITDIRGLTEAEIASLQALGAIDETTP